MCLNSKTFNFCKKVLKKCVFFSVLKTHIGRKVKTDKSSSVIMRDSSIVRQVGTPQNDRHCHTERSEVSISRFVILSVSEVSQINCSGFFDCPSLTVHLRMTIAIVILIHYRLSY